MAKARIKPGGKVFRDPIHRLIRIEPEDEFILDLIDTPEFQRLRRIRQLGVSWLTFHGAEHSRFVHSLGVFNFAQRIIESLCRRYAGSDVEKYLREHAQVVKAAALLHDIGHGPFSHMIERAFASGGQHESKTVSIIRDPKSRIRSILGDKAESVAQLIDHTSPHTLLMDIVSSQLDADRMDYLLRDSYCTGVQYGLYDAEWVLNALCVGRDKGNSQSSTPSWRLCLDSRRGEKSAEQFLLARAHMSEQVYFHRVTRGYEAMLLALFGEATRLTESEGLPEETPAVVTNFFSLRGVLEGDAWLALDESQLTVAMHSWSNSRASSFERLARWSTAFLRREKVFTFCSLSRLQPLEYGDLWLRLEKEGFKRDIDWSVDDASFAVYKGIQYTLAKDSEDEESRLESIFLASGKPSDAAKPIELSSDLVRSLDQKRHSLVRLFIDKNRLDKALPILQKSKLTVDLGDQA